ncbi:related to HypA-like protein [Ramularia collo-cygni]|uniref:Related to HypA-like protein n=1 Tax=Ramularia collo-cygni TaxID=112498 RepID=A0A2D3UYE3_9PEZI|nr:related to HypA-like protein [Ramularia collo-cygni]CZT18220.1 related to HypA-like protein [Ramularia collo-cygni]
MATSSTVQLKVGKWLVYHREGITAESAKQASELLQANHERHHIFFNLSGFHNHIAHHLLTLWALKASPIDLQRAFDLNQSYQRPAFTPQSNKIAELEDVGKFMRHLGPETHFPDFLIFFKQEIEKSSWQDVLQKYVFAGDERADDMFVRMYASLLHPIIHLGFGVEFHQPVIIAEALAQAACHQNKIAALFLPAEKAAKENSAPGKSIVQLLDEIHADEKMRQAPRQADTSKLLNGILARAGDRMIHYASQVSVEAHDLERKTAEMINACALFTGGAQKSDKHVKFDFFFIHNLNSSIFFSAFLREDWLSEASKVRLLEWKIRMDVAQYASARSPDIRLVDIREYRPKSPSGWDQVMDRVCRFGDDGHAAKLIRALAHGERVCKKFEDDDAFRLKGGDWLQLAHMAIDSVELPGDTWVRMAGFDQAWGNVPLRAQL